MAKKLAEHEVASVRLLTLELSEDEMTVLIAALTALLQGGDDSTIEAKTSASRDEVEAIVQDLHAFLTIPMAGTHQGVH